MHIELTGAARHYRAAAGEQYERGRRLGYSVVQQGNDTELAQPYLQEEKSDNYYDKHPDAVWIGW